MADVKTGFLGIILKPFSWLWSGISALKGFSPLLIIFLIIIGTAGFHWLRTGDSQIFVKETIGRMVSVDVSMNTYADELRAGRTIHPIFWGLQNLAILGYFWTILFIVFSKINHDAAGINAILASIIFAFLLVIANFNYSQPEPYVPLKGSINFLSALFDKAPPFSTKLENITGYDINDSILNKTYVSKVTNGSAALNGS